MTSETHSFFDSISNNTHSELSSLREQMEEFQIIYQSNEIIPFTNNESRLIEPILIESNLTEPSLNDESDLNEPILNNEKINKFRKIYSKTKIEDIDEKDDDSTQKLKQKLNKKLETSNNNFSQAIKDWETKLSETQTKYDNVLLEQKKVTAE